MCQRLPSPCRPKPPSALPPRSQSGIDALAPATAGPAKLGLRGLELAGGAPLVYVAAGQHEVGLWDLLDCKCHQVGAGWHARQGGQRATRQPRMCGRARTLAPSLAAALTPPRPKPPAPGQVLRVLAREEAGGMCGYDVPASLAHPPQRGTAAPPPSVRQPDQAASLARALALDQLQVPSPRVSGIRALLPMSSGALMTAGARRLRCCAAALLRCCTAALPHCCAAARLRGCCARLQRLRLPRCAPAAAAAWRLKGMRGAGAQPRARPRARPRPAAHLPTPARRQPAATPTKRRHGPVHALLGGGLAGAQLHGVRPGVARQHMRHRRHHRRAAAAARHVQVRSGARLRAPRPPAAQPPSRRPSGPQAQPHNPRCPRAACCPRAGTRSAT
jgi:hypothetical protein